MCLSMFRFIKKCSDINKLSNLINNEYKRINEISDEERKNRLICFLSSFINNGFHSNFPHQLLLEDGTNEQYKEGGKQLSVEILKYIKKLIAIF